MEEFFRQIETPRYRARRNRAQTHVHRNYRGGQVRAVNGDAITLRLCLETHRVGDRVVDRGLFEAGVGIQVGHPVMCVVQGAGAADYVVTAVRPSTYAGSGTSKFDGGVADGEFWPGVCGEREGWTPVYGPEDATVWNQ